MALPVVWSSPAQAQRRAVLKYWIKRNGSAAYSQKLDLRFRAALRMVARNPMIGRPSSFDGVRVKTVGDYLLFYHFENNVITVLVLWDNRQDPDRLRIL